jgi:hypothetical protein
MSKKTYASLGYGNILSPSLVWLENHKSKKQELIAKQEAMQYTLSFNNKTRTQDEINTTFVATDAKK